MEQKKKKTIAVIISILIIFLGVLFAAGIFFHADERLKDIFASEKTASETNQNEDIQKEPDFTEEIAEESVEEETVPDTTIVITGDVELSNAVLNNYNNKGIEGVVSGELLSELQNADVLEINNEFCFSERGEQAPDKQFTFRVNPSYVSVLTDMGVDVAGLANNHVLDFGKDALTDTFTTLSDAGIEYTGAGTSHEDASKLVIKEVNGKKYGFLAASRVIPVGSWNVDNSQPGVFTCYDTTALCNSITAAKQQVDYLFVCVHWGVEHTDELTDYQVANGHAYIDAGADAVIGSHPHVLQGMEYYNGKPIFYSLGNFIFNENINSTMAVKFTFTPEGEVSMNLLPATATGATTSMAGADKAASIYAYLQSLSSTVFVGSEGEISEASLVP